MKNTLVRGLWLAGACLPFLAYACPVAASGLPSDAFWKLGSMSFGSGGSGYTALRSQLDTFGLATHTLVRLAQADPLADGIYYLGDDGKRHAFPDQVYASWYADQSAIRPIPLEQMSCIPLGGNATFRPGFKLIKFEGAPNVYAVDAGGLLRWITAEPIAVTLYGSNWKQNIEVVSDALYINYRMGADIKTSDDYHPTDSGVTYIGG